MCFSKSLACPYCHNTENCMMKHFPIIILATLAAGWGAAEPATTLSFDEAVRASVETDGSRSEVVITVDTNSTLAIAKRPVKLEELKGILSVTGLIENPPAILVRANNKTPHKPVRDVLDFLTKSGMWKISFEAVDGEQLYRKKGPTTSCPHPRPTQRTAGNIKESSPFGAAVLASGPATQEFPIVIVMIDKDGSISIAGLPVKVSQLKDIRSVSGLPINPPDVIVRVHEEATDRTALNEVVDELEKAGMPNISCFSASAKDWNRLNRRSRSPSENLGGIWVSP